MRAISTPKVDKQWKQCKENVLRHDYQYNYTKGLYSTFNLIEPSCFKLCNTHPHSPSYNCKLIHFPFRIFCFVSKTMAHQVTENWLSFVVGSVFEKTVDVSSKNCAGHAFQCPILHKCQQLSLYEKLVMYFSQIKDEVCEDLPSLWDTYSALMNLNSSSKSGMISYAQKFIEMTTAEALYYGNYYKQETEKLRKKRVESKKTKKPKTETVIDDAFNQSFNYFQ